jgi:hypothetical protein
MKIWTNLLTTVVCVVLLCAGTSYAATILYTAPAQAGSYTLFCDIVNVSPSTAAPKYVTIEIIDYDANVVNSYGPFSLSSGHGEYLGDSSGNGAYCRFTVTGAKTLFRAMAIYANGSGYHVIVPAQ